MKQLIFFICILITSLKSISQTTTVLSPKENGDSSFYHIERISNNEFWIGGEYGVLKSIDSTFQIRSISYPNSGSNILNITNTKNKVIICKDHGQILLYDKKTKTFEDKSVSLNFKDKCFYDMTQVSENRFLICGGTSGIAKAEKKIPKGFIIEVDSNLNIIQEVWSSFRKFPWSIKCHQGIIYASIFNGFNSRIVTFNSDLNKSKKVKKVKGLVHDIKIIEDDFWYCGSKSIKYQQNGIIGNKSSHQISTGTGCIWSIKGNKESVEMVSNNGNLIIQNRKGIRTTHMPSIKNIFYDLEKITPQKYVLVGHGKSIILFNISN